MTIYVNAYIGLDLLNLLSMPAVICHQQDVTGLNKSYAIIVTVNPDPVLRWTASRSDPHTCDQSAALTSLWPFHFQCRLGWALEMKLQDTFLLAVHEFVGPPAGRPGYLASMSKIALITFVAQRGHPALMLMLDHLFCEPAALALQPYCGPGGQLLPLIQVAAASRLQARMLL